MARPHLPEVKVVNAGSALLQPIPNRLGQTRVGHPIQQHGAGVGNQAQRPARNHQRPDDTHQRVHPDPAVEPARKQADDGEDGSGRVGQDMQIGRAQIGVAWRSGRDRRRIPRVRVIMTVLMLMTVTMRMIVIAVSVLVPRAMGMTIAATFMQQPDAQENELPRGKTAGYQNNFNCRSSSLGLP